MIDINNDFWLAFDKLIVENELVIDRKKGTRHPRYDKLVYPLDYGYLKGTSSMDGGGIDVWKGSCNSGFDAIAVTVDILKQDSEVKLLIDCTEEEKQIVYDFHNSDYMKAVLINRIRI